MKVFTCFLLFRILAHKSMAMTRIRTKVDQTSVNSAIENISELSHEEYSGDTKILDNVHHFMTRGTTATDKNKNKYHVFRAVKIETLTDFIQEAVNILNTYEDTAFQDFFRILDNEIKRYDYRDCKFYELMQNHDTRSLLAGALTIIRGKSVSFTKENINEMADMMRDRTNGNDITELLDYINSLYSHSEHKFHRALNELKHYRKMKSIKARNNLVKAIRRSVRDNLFDHYTALDSNTRRELKERIEKFWNRFKNNPASSVEVNNHHEMYNAVSKTVISSIKVSKNVMNEDKEPVHYSKIDSQTNLRTKVDRKSKENDNQLPQDKETDKDGSSNEFDMLNTDDTRDEISSGQSFDSSSNSIKQSQERSEEYRTQRYMTLYTEEISPQANKARTAKKTGITPISANKMTKRTIVPRRPTTTPAPRYSSEDESDMSKKVDLSTSQDSDDTEQDVSESEHDTDSVLMAKEKVVRRTRHDDDEQRKHGKLESKSKRKDKTPPLIGEFNAEIDLQLADLLKPLGLFFVTVTDKNSRYDTTLYQRSFKQTKPVPTKQILHSMRAVAEPKPKKRTAHTKPPSRYSRTRTYKSIYLKPSSNVVNNISTLLSNESNIVLQLIKDKERKRIFLTRRNANNNNSVAAKNFNKDVITRIDALEQDLQELKQMINVKKHDNNTDKYDAKDKVENKRHVTLKYKVERLIKEYEDMGKREINKTNNDEKVNTESTTKSTTYSKTSVIHKDVANTAVIGNKNISKVKEDNANDKKGLNKEKNNNSVTTVTGSSVKVEPVVTTATSAVTSITKGRPEPSVYYPEPDQNPFLEQVDPFGHDSDGLNFNNNYGM